MCDNLASDGAARLRDTFHRTMGKEQHAMGKQTFLSFEYSEVLDPKTRELCALAAGAAGGCGH